MKWYHKRLQNVYPRFEPWQACNVRITQMIPRSKEIAHLYSQQRNEYAKFAPESFSWQFIEKPAFDKYIIPLLTPQTKILDAGCGTGRSAEYLLKKGTYPDNIIMVDINHDMLSTASQTAIGVNLLQADLECLPIPENSQDLVICSHVLHYFDNPKYFTTLNEFRRVLKLDGTLFLITTHPMRTMRHDLSRYRNRQWIMDRTPWGTDSPLFHRPITDWVNLALQAGFRLEILDEVEVDPRGIESSQIDYEKYSSCPPRLALILKK